MTAIDPLERDAARWFAAQSLIDTVHAGRIGRPTATVRRDGGEHWRDRAACTGIDPVIFYTSAPSLGDRDVNTAQALAICRGCEVQEECLEYAVTSPEQFGVWGAKTEEQRRSIRRKRARDRSLS